MSEEPIPACIRTCQVQAMKQLKLLLVEDSEPVRSRLTQMLESDRVTLTPVATVAAAIDALAKPHDLISVDLNLPDGSGIEIIKHAKAMAMPAVIFVLTGVPEMKEDCLRWGADRVFDKSTELTMYLTAIEDQSREAPDAQ
jgi:CheY-like chemotaxis protein